MPLNSILVEEDIFACLYAAIIHDFGHPGVNNSLMVATSSLQAYLYNDKVMSKLSSVAPIHQYSLAVL